ncbi:TetR/AcrR family transcriptional regulator [Subtercola lobariae]|uniref:Transcriptional regulator n=1 Tax=Subtercola lobariae TaxID=1588641 RepID=A0A917BAE8_9MICO|nr:TetR/AcrR family transcriptional regulator [Subtercola lobariae]GGF34407.1 transcriptional regulator [Subtercola lobariae]
MSIIPTSRAVSAPNRAKTPKGQATRARIVDAAAALVFEEGVAGTSLDDVGAAARVGKSQIYHYFADKSSLISEVVTRQTIAVLAGQEPHISRLDNWGSWAAWRDQLVREQDENHCTGGCPLGSIANELADTDEDARAVLVDSFDQWERAFADGITRMKAAGALRADADAASLASAVLAAVQGGLLLCKTRKSTKPLEASLDASIAYLRTFAP